MNSIAGIVILLHALAAPPGAAEALAPQAGLLVLKNGHVLAGEITRAGDFVIVTQGANSELRMPTSEIEFICRDFDEAYAQKESCLPPGKIAPHLDLAEWCLRHDLPAKAAEQVIAAMQIDAKHPRIALLETRLKHIAERPNKSDAKPAESNAMSIEQLDKFTRELPKSTVEKFAATVQPILLNRCATGGCHGPGSAAEFKLFRPAAGQVANRRFTQRNLFAALQQIDRTNPEQSPLLLKPQQRHGNAAGPVFDKQSQTQLDQLASWVRQAMVKAEPTQPTSITPVADQLLQPNHNTTEPEPAPKPTAPVTPDKSTGKTPEDRLKAVTANRQFTPRDPFDPEQFNRLHHPQP